MRIGSGDWVDVPFIPGSFAVNSGDTMRRWTNGRFLSTPHRAVPPVSRHRYAIPFFLAPHIDTVIECLPTCISPGKPRAGSRSPMNNGSPSGPMRTMIRNASRMLPHRCDAG